MIKQVTWGLLGAALATATAQAATIKIGFVTTLSTPAAVIGNDMRDAVELALEHIGSKAGAHDVEVIYADDEFNPQKGKQATERLVKQDRWTSSPDTSGPMSCWHRPIPCSMRARS